MVDEVYILKNHQTGRGTGLHQYRIYNAAFVLCRVFTGTAEEAAALGLQAVSPTQVYNATKGAM